MKLRLPLTSEIKRIGIHSSSVFFGHVNIIWKTDRHRNCIHSYLWGKEPGKNRDVSRFSFANVYSFLVKLLIFAQKDGYFGFCLFFFFFGCNGLEKERNSHHVRNRIVSAI